MGPLAHGCLEPLAMMKMKMGGCKCGHMQDPDPGGWQHDREIINRQLFPWRAICGGVPYAGGGVRGACGQWEGAASRRPGQLQSGTANINISLGLAAN